MLTRARCSRPLRSSGGSSRGRCSRASRPRTRPRCADRSRSALRAGILAEPALGSFEFAHALFAKRSIAICRPIGGRSSTPRGGCPGKSGCACRALGEIAQHLLAAACVVGKERALKGSMRRGSEPSTRAGVRGRRHHLPAAAADGVLPPFRDRAECAGLSWSCFGEARSRLADYEGARKACEAAAAIARRSAGCGAFRRRGARNGSRALAGHHRGGARFPSRGSAQHAARGPQPSSCQGPGASRGGHAAGAQPRRAGWKLAREAVGRWPARWATSPRSGPACTWGARAGGLRGAERALRVGQPAPSSSSIQAGDSMPRCASHIPTVLRLLSSSGGRARPTSTWRRTGSSPDRLGMPAPQWLTLIMRSLRASGTEFSRKGALR